MNKENLKQAYQKACEAGARYDNTFMDLYLQNLQMDSTSPELAKAQAFHDTRKLKDAYADALLAFEEAKLDYYTNPHRYDTELDDPE